MNIIHIIPGSGGSFYCGNCLRDSKLFEALRAEGHDAVKIPMYLPLFSHETRQEDIPVFYGAISIYLKQKYALFRHAPQWLDRWLNSRPMLNFAARMANSTRASGLEDMTISMLMGEHGRQKDELEKMVHWLKTHLKPDVVHISNALLLGLAPKLRQELGVPVVCSLQDEHVWMEPMHAPMAEKIWNLMREKAASVDMFIPVSHYYALFMQQKLHLPDNKLTSLHLGIDPIDYDFIHASEKPDNIGYLSRICPENGADILVDAFILMKQSKEHTSTRLILTGGYTADDKVFIKKQKKKIKDAGLTDFVEFIDDFEGDARKQFFQKVKLLSVPVPGGEAFGIYLTEAMASGIPVVQPALGAFPEIIEKSDGGHCYPHNTPQELANALDTLLKNPGEINRLSHNARKSMENDFNIHHLAKELTGIYHKLNETQIT